MTLNAQQLLERFAVYGRFYEKCIGGVDEKLRDRLEIAPVDWDLLDVVHREPDLLVVMMNPGASKPLAALWQGRADLDFVPTQPDRTQYQIMQLLLAARQQGLNWRHARILNLSDLRTPKSNIFAEKLDQYIDDDSHSLFSMPRMDECKALFACLETPVLCAWGLNSRFANFALRALAAARGHTLLGLTADGVAYRHPLPQRFDLQVEWLRQMYAQIQRIAPVPDVT
jgi:hypothetical protein